MVPSPDISTLNRVSIPLHQEMTEMKRKDILKKLLQVFNLKNEDKKER